MRAAYSDLVPAESTDRLIIRQDIDRRVAAMTKSPSSDNQIVKAPGASAMQALMALARDPKYAAELYSGYADIILTEHGERAAIPAFKSALLKLTPATTPKATAARAALDAMNRTKVKGYQMGVIHAAREKVTAAAAPRKQTGTVRY